MKKFGLTGNQLKMIALAAMTVDHIGHILFPQILILRIIGRLAFPIFAYMIAEGCRYTRSMGRYLGLMTGAGVVCQVVTYFVTGSLHQSIFITFSLSIMLIWLRNRAFESKTPGTWIAAGAGLTAVVFLTRVLPVLLRGTDYGIDYGFWGVLLPVAIYSCKTQRGKLGTMAVTLLIICADYRNMIFAYALLALPLLALYNGQRGKWKMKYLFYIYYPAHLAVLHLISML